ncbi:MAG: transposase [Acidimicrobiales bacterium]
MPSVCRAVYLPAASLFTTTLSAQNGVIQRGPDRGPRPSNWVCPFFLKVLPSQAGSPCVSSGSEGIGHVGSPTDVTDEQWTLVQPLVNVAGKRGRRLGNDIRAVVDGVLYIARTGDQWRCLPPQFGPWARVWPQFRRWSRNGTWSRLLAELHRKARTKLGRAAAVPSMVVIGTHLPRPGRPVRGHQGRQAGRGRRRHQAGRFGSTPCRS